MQKPERHLALLRGINIGGKKSITMATLASFFEDANCKDVETHIQSGNVVFSADAKTLSRVGFFVCASIQNQLGFKTSLMLRSASDLTRIVAGNPYADVIHTHVVFLPQEPTAEQIALLDPNYSPGDEFTVIGREIYMHLPKGHGQSKLVNAWFDSKLKTVSTIRNWRTVLKLQAMLAA